MNPLRRAWRSISFTSRFVFCKVTPFQCHHCGETFYAPSEKEMETMMENHLYESHREEWEKLPSRLGMDSLKITRFEIFKRVHHSLPEQLRNRDEINRAIAEQINYATASSQFKGDDEEMRRKLKALSDELVRNGADEAADEITRAVDMRSHYVALAESIALERAFAFAEEQSGKSR